MAQTEVQLPDARPHTLLDDTYAFYTGTALITIGMVLLKAAGLVTAGVAGIALILSYLVPVPVGILFTLVNLPFFAFGAIVMGRTFIIKSVIASSAISLALIAASHAITIAAISVPFAAIIGGTAIGVGILAIARHGSGVGGTIILSLWLYRTRGINVGIVALVIDGVILTAAAFTVTGYVLLWSALSAVAIHMTLFAWHRPGRYIGY
ncbi:MAG: YitT family protein [Rhizomicrobium sp.]|nr:YitT family protein [Rhizomicrobium sp.]